MIREGRIGTFETVMILVFPILGKIYLSYASGIIKENLSAAWLAVLIGCLAAALMFIPLAALLRRFPGEDLIGIARQSLGPFPGGLVIGLVVLFIFFSTATTLRQIGETVIGTALPQVPLLLMIAAFAVLMALTGRWGLEAIARVASFITPYLLIGGTALLLMHLPNMKADYLAPLWGPGPGRLALNGILRSSLMSELVLLGFIAPAVARKKIVPSGAYLIVIATIVLTGTMLIGQMIFPPSVGAENTFPFYEIARSIYWGRFYQRVEFLFILVWIVMVMLSLTVRFYFSITAFAKIFKLPYYQPLIPLAALATLGAALLFPDYATTVHWDNLIRGRWAWVPAFAAPALIYVIAVLRGKRGERDA
ncbi:MAG: GerAB/ArcD/ProY family transporter [Patescibacteria group bacterium]